VYPWVLTVQCRPPRKNRWRQSRVSSSETYSHRMDVIDQSVNHSKYGWGKVKPKVPLGLRSIPRI
jgi:hypothetical protein